MAYLVVNHVSDESKQEGFVESYQMVNIEVQNDDGSTSIIPKRMNFVHWPQLPNPFLHEEWSEDLTFVTVYVPENDNNEDDEDSELNETIVELLENDYPEVYQAILSEALADEPEDDEEEAEEISAN